MRPVHSPSQRNQRGTAVVEMAIILPLLMLLLLGVMDFGLIVREHQILQNAAREGARFSSLPVGRVDYSTTASANAGEAVIRGKVTAYLSQEGITLPDPTSNIAIDQNEPIPLGGGLSATGSKITITYSRSLLVGASSLWPFGTVALRGESIFRNLYD